MTYKTILTGRLEFGSSRSFEKVLTMYEHRAENYYKSDIILKEDEEYFDGNCYCLRIPRTITHVSEKTWKNTINLLEYVAQFAVAGCIRAWMTDEGKVRRQAVIEPKSDKIAVQAFLRGRELIKTNGKESEALEALNRAIRKYDRHGQAFERRGHLNFKLKKYTEALEDFSKSIELNPIIPDPHLGRANVKIIQDDLKAAIADLTQAIKKSIPLLPIYWKARRLRAECHLQLGEYKEAIQDLKFFTKRQFKPDNPNFLWRKKAFFDYGRALLEVGDYEEAVKAFNTAAEIKDGHDPSPQADELLYLGIARRKAGDKAFVQDWKEAAGLGSEEAAKLLEEYA